MFTGVSLSVDNKAISFRVVVGEFKKNIFDSFKVKNHFLFHQILIRARYKMRSNL